MSSVNLLQQGQHADGLQELKDIIPQGPFVAPLHPIDHLFAVQSPVDARISAPGHPPTHPVRQVLRALVSRACFMVHLPLLHPSQPLRKVDHRSKPRLMLESQYFRVEYIAEVDDHDATDSSSGAF